MTQQTLDQYKDEHRKDEQRNAILFEESPFRRYHAHVQKAAARLLDIWQQPTMAAGQEELAKAQWHIEEAQALREEALKTLDKG
jgi:hypothetical protein